MSLTYSTVRLVQYTDFEKLVQTTYDRPDYEFDHDCFMNNGEIQYFTVPSNDIYSGDVDEFQDWLAHTPDPSALSKEDQDRLELYLSMYDEDAAKFAQDPAPYLKHRKSPGDVARLLLKEDDTLRTKEEYRQHLIEFSLKYSPAKTSAPLDPLTQDLFERGLIEAGDYAIEKSW